MIIKSILALIVSYAFLAGIVWIAGYIIDKNMWND